MIDTILNSLEDLAKERENMLSEKAKLIVSKKKKNKKVTEAKKSLDSRETNESKDYLENKDIGSINKVNVLKKTDKVPQNIMSQQRLRDGLILSEILGQPVCKKRRNRMGRR